MSANIVLVLGDTGSGKTSSLRHLDPKQTAIINIADKKLPMKGAMVNYIPLRGDNNGNLVNLSMPRDLASVIKTRDKLFGAIRYYNARPEIKYLHIDDAQYFMSFEMFSRVNEKKYDKFTEMAVNLVNLIALLKSCRDDLNISVAWHEESGEKDGSVYFSAKTCGKMISQNLTIEGLFTYVVRSVKRPALWELENGHCFCIGEECSTAKMPMGMFGGIDVRHIPNDLKLVFQGIHAYDQGIDFDWQKEYEKILAA